MATFAAYRRKMLELYPEMGQVWPIASLTVTTAVVTRLAQGSVTAEKYKGQYLLRAEAASQPADRERLCSNFTSSSGTFTHAGTNYGDTTATSEYLEVLRYEPWRYDTAVNLAVNKVRFTDRTEFPTVQGQTIYYLGDLAAWVDEPNRVERVTYVPNPLVSRDRFIEKWNTVSSAGVLQPDHWTVAGASGSVARSTTQNRRSRYSAAITRSGTNVTLTQTCSLLINGTAQGNGEDLRGKTLRIVGVGWASSASQLRFQVADGTQTVSTSYHTGGSSWEELSTTITVATAATTLTIAASVEVNGTAYVDECFALEDQSWGDAVRRNAYTEREIRVPRNWYSFGQVPGEISVSLPAKGRGGQYVLYTSRPYPQFDSTRVLAGTADADSSDAPLVPVACGAIAELLMGLIGQAGVDDTRTRMLVYQWQRRAEMEGAKAKATEPSPFGVEFPGREVSMAPPVRGL